MKLFLSVTFGFACLILVIVLVATKRSDYAQHENDAAVITDYSNQLTSAQTEMAVRLGRLLSISNILDESHSVSSGLSNHLTEALSSIAQNQEQITNLNRQVAEMHTENQALTSRFPDLTNQIDRLSKQIASAEASLHEQSNDYVKNSALLENRLRRDVAERVLVERSFNDPSELQARLEKLKYHPAAPVTAESIYAGLDVEVKSNGTFHVLSPE